MKNSVLAMAILAFLNIACGDSIPQSYRGDFVEARTGATLKLGMESGTYTESSGRKLEARMYQMTFKDLKEGKPGIYLKDNPSKKNILELYWLNPDISTKQEAGGIEYFQAEIFYYRFDRNASARVDVMPTVHSLEGIVSLDIPTQQWQVGWPAESETLEFRRLMK